MRRWPENAIWRMKKRCSCFRHGTRLVINPCTNINSNCDGCRKCRITTRWCPFSRVRVPHDETNRYNEQNSWCIGIGKELKVNEISHHGPWNDKACTDEEATNNVLKEKLSQFRFYRKNSRKTYKYRVHSEVQATKAYCRAPYY